MSERWFRLESCEPPPYDPDGEWQVYREVDVPAALAAAQQRIADLKAETIKLANEAFRLDAQYKTERGQVDEFRKAALADRVRGNEARAQVERLRAALQDMMDAAENDPSDLCCIVSDIGRSALSEATAPAATLPPGRELEQIREPEPTLHPDHALCSDQCWACPCMCHVPLDAAQQAAPGREAKQQRIAESEMRVVEWHKDIARLDEARATVERYRAALKHYGGAHMEDQGVCVQCALDERLNDEDADWPCWYTQIMSTAISATPPPGRELEQAVIAAARKARGFDKRSKLSHTMETYRDESEAIWEIYDAIDALDAAQRSGA